ncbi:hypothetical protein O6H91_16G035000 [Diphasiastrum complanatum]|uniref:Uncharacterized protein n=1 Tax=Diphasiastrum complanatum TaxID=34168 RepID=A0ACC2BBH9_DIPCM|nr:hypothetical protein O6H91_16G035000 [Diphasiastrum complanatum]
MASKRILIVSTSHDRLGDTGSPTGLWLEELAAPYYIWKSKGFSVDIASIKGGKIPLDPASLSEGSTTEYTKKFSNNEHNLKEALQNSISVKDVSETYDAIFLPGGHGVVYDFPGNPDLVAVIEKLVAQDKIVAAVCHGPAGLVGPTAPNGEPIVIGKKVTGFSNTEEEAVGKTKVVPFLLEDKLKELGGLYERAPDWHPFAVADGKLITGQNPQSSEKVAQLVVVGLE